MARISTTSDDNAQRLSRCPGHIFEPVKQGRRSVYRCCHCEGSITAAYYGWYIRGRMDAARAIANRLTL
jgi:hypothetical protein